MSDIRSGLRFWLLGGAALLLAESASAQVIVGGGEPAVSVDGSVLDELGPPRNLPGILLPNLGVSSGHAVAQPRQPMAGLAAPRLKPPSAQPALKAPKASAPAAEKKGEKKSAKKGKGAPKEASVETVKLAPPAAAEPKTEPKVEAKAEQPAEKKPLPLPAPAVVEKPAPAVETNPTELTKAEPAKAEPAKAEPAKTEPVKAEPAKTQVAAVTPMPGAKPLTGEDGLQLIFAPGAPNFPDSAKGDIQKLAERLNKNPDLRVTLMAYAQNTDSDAEATASKAKRLSLSRALAVRSQLLDLGVRSTRVDVKAMGDAAGGGPADRVDVLVVKRQ